MNAVRLTKKAKSAFKTGPVYLVRSQQMLRNINTSALRSKGRDLTKLKEKQKFFQLDETVPVYLKKGASDRMIFALISTGVAISLIMSAQFVKRLVYPPPPS